MQAKSEQAPYVRSIPFQLCLVGKLQNKDGSTK
jgi:hypothetical protein